MGFITSVARCVRENRLSLRLSNAKPQRLDDDSNDLIKTISHTASVAPAESIASASTMVQHSSQEPVIPTESPAHMKQPAPWDLDIRTMFDEVDSLDPATSRAIRALSMPEYPVLRMDTIQSPFDTPTKKLDDAIDPGEKDVQNGGKTEKSKKSRKSREEKRSRDTQTEESGRASRIKRSMTGLLKRRSLKVPQTPTSLKTLRNSNSPKLIDSSSIVEEDVVGEKDDLKWLEANGLRRFDKRSSGFWTGEGMGRLW
ncbi:uncharacterized protein N7473_003995 [Penicillium subrubescens]|uniref:Uncharacterized protein n=1 Tax=Penicillium subrubescens TaxID=1316194 RepID=A0A1Q5U9Z0_9EURO|nr:uncharacterized protein N7473_003995 [Penicillium subrubescens]KAJ5907079.1 hypothetical protein N7473_003995 [Penicillium subrubescens]OKP09294.1 hypothetical protein PENSUB_5380 [Penicillium subrubescens]